MKTKFLLFAAFAIALMCFAPRARAQTFTTITLCDTYTTTAQATANTASDQNLIACSIPAAVLNKLNVHLVVIGQGNYSLGAASTVAFKVKLCTVSGCGSGTAITEDTWTTASNTNTSVVSGFQFNADIGTTTIGATGTSVGKGVATINVGASNVAAATPFVDAIAANSSTIDLTGALFLQTTFTSGTGNAATTCTLNHLQVALVVQI